MTPQDLPAFRELFENLLFSGLSFTPPKDKREQALATYFQALEAYDFAAVRLAYERLQHGLTKWPAVSQWVQAMPRDGRAGGVLLIMNHVQARESDDAEQRFYEGDFCRCRECVEASATHLNLRYVPCLNANGEVLEMLHPRKQRVVVLGEWIHGHRLKRWYAARAEFYEKLESLKPGVKRELEKATL